MDGDLLHLGHPVPVLLIHAATVGLGEAAVCYVLGIPLMDAVNRLRKKMNI